MAELFNKNAIRIALVGKTGAGKSALGNTLLGKSAFKSVTGSESVTIDSKMESAELSTGQLIQVVDTPGIMDTENRNVIHEVTSAITYLTPGPHAFLLVLQPNRATTEEINSLSELTNLFGDDSYLEHTIIVMVRKNEIENDDGTLMDIRTFVETRTCDAVKHLYRKCGKRIIAVDNKEKDEGIKENFRKDVVDMISKFNGYYSHDYFKMVMKNKQLLDLLEKQKKTQATEIEMLKRGQIIERAEREKEREELMNKIERTMKLLEDQIKEKNRKNCVLS